MRGLCGAVILGRGEDHRRPENSRGGDNAGPGLDQPHAGSLPRLEELIALNEQRATGDFSNEAKYLGKLRAAVGDVVARQRETGIDFVNDGEYGHSMGIGA